MRGVADMGGWRPLPAQAAMCMPMKRLQRLPYQLSLVEMAALRLSPRASLTRPRCTHRWFTYLLLSLPSFLPRPAPVPAAEVIASLFAGHSPCRTEAVLAVEGRLRLRPSHLVNPGMVTGALEVEIVAARVLSAPSGPLPLLVSACSIAQAR